MKPHPLKITLVNKHILDNKPHLLAVELLVHVLTNQTLWYCLLLKALKMLVSVSK